MDQTNRQTPVCGLCRREVKKVSRHHLVPRQKGGKHGEVVPLCQPCHSTIHYTFTNKELATEFHTVEKLRKSEKLEKYLNWIRKRPIEKIATRKRKE